MRILRFQDQTAEAQQVLYRPDLTHVYLLQCPKIYALVFISSENGFLNAMHSPIGHDYDIQEIAVKPYEKFELRHQEKQKKKYEHQMTRGALIDADGEKRKEADCDDEQCQKAHLHQRPQHSNPVLSERTLECLSGVLAGEIGAYSLIVIMRYHKKKRGKAVIQRRMIE